MLSPPTWWVGTIDLSEDESAQLSSDVPQLYTNTDRNGFSYKPFKCCLSYVMAGCTCAPHPPTHTHRENILECTDYAGALLAS